MSGTVDLTTSASFGTIGDAIFTTDTTHSAGTGGFNTFVQLEHNGTEQGYNTDASAQFDEKNGHTNNHALLLADVPIFIGDGSGGTVEGVAYREFKLDINEARAFLSLDKLQIWQEEAGNLTNFNTATGFGAGHTNHLVYDMDAGGDAWVALNAGLSTGSGGGDMRLLIRDDLFINDGAHRYVYLYSMFGQQGGQWAADAGFEEWGTATPTGGLSGGAVLHLDKTAAVPGGTADTAGEVITYTYAVSNFGAVALSGITVTDPSVGDLAPSLSGGFNVGDVNHNNQLDTTETWIYTAHHTVTQADIDDNGQGDGSIDNTATADSNQTGPVSDSAAVPIQRNPHITVTKTATIPDTTTPGDPTTGDGKIDSPADDISYTVALLNDGNTTLHGVIVNDSLLGPLTTHVETGGTGTNGDDIFDVGETWTFTTAGYDVTQADIDNRGSVDGTPDDKIHNQVDVTTDEVLASGGADVAIDYRPHLSVTKTASIPDTATAGDPTLGDHKIDSPADDISYTVTVVNDGNVTLHSVIANDPLLGLLTTHTESGGTGVNGDDILDVGETWTYTASYDVQQSDIDNRGNADGTADDKIHNEVGVFTDEGASGSASADVLIDYRPGLAFDKAGVFRDDNGDGFSQVGEHIDYTFTLTNTGNATLHNVGVNDADATLTMSGSNIASLAPGATDTSWSASYAITQTDITAGFFDNTAVGISDEASTPDTEHVVLPPAPPAGPVLSLVKTSSTLIDSDESGGPSVKDDIQYFFSATNNGAVALHGMQLDDTLFGMIAFTPDTPDGNGQLDPGETWLMSRTYITKATDIAAHTVHNEATVTGLNPSNVAVVSNTAVWDVNF